MSEKRIYDYNGNEIAVYISNPIKTSSGYYVDVDVVPMRGHLRIYVYKKHRTKIAYFEEIDVKHKLEGTGTALVNVAKQYSLDTCAVKFIELVIGDDVPTPERNASWKIIKRAGFKRKEASEDSWVFEAK